MAWQNPALAAWMALVHRTLAVPLCLLLALWFATGTVLSFVPYPSLGTAGRLARMDPVDPAFVALSPTEALANSGIADATHLRLVLAGGAPRYLVGGSGERQVAVDARTGQVLPPLEAGAIAGIAARAEGLRIAGVTGPFAYDLFTVHDKYRAARPYFRVDFADPARTVLYVSALTGEPMQRTVGRERAWNRVGATVHWLNIPWLREHFGTWRWTVWGLALGGILLALLGLVLGGLRWRANRRAHRKGFSPYRGLLRWHHLIGAVAGLLLVAWVGSGWLSLEATHWFTPAAPSELQQAAFAGLRLEDVARRLSLPALRAMPPAREYEWRASGGEPLLILRGNSQGPAGLDVWRPDADGVWQSGGDLPHALLAQAVGAAWPGLGLLGIAAIGPDDVYALRGAPFPPGALRFELDDPAATWVHVDVRTGELLGVMDHSRRVYRWLVDGLHTYDFPWLNRGGLWHLLLVCGTTLGFALSVTGTVLAARRLRRGLR